MVTTARSFFKHRLHSSFETAIALMLKYRHIGYENIPDQSRKPSLFRTIFTSLKYNLFYDQALQFRTAAQNPILAVSAE